MLNKLKKLFAPRDLTEGNTLSGIVMFAIPLLIGNLVQQMYSTVDAIVVGQYVGDAALGAVGLTMPIVNLIFVLFMGISSGATIVVSQYFGAKDRKNLSKAVGTTIMLTVIAGLIMSVVGAVLSRPLLILLDTPESMMQMATDYLAIVMIGLVASGLYNILSGVMRGMGDSVSPLLYLMVACVLNIVLDILFVTRFGMTTDGVALATIISQAVSAFLCIRRLARMKDVIDLDRSTLRVSKSITMRIVRLGVPSGVTQMIFSMSSILVQSLTNSLGANIVTANTMVMRIDGFAMMPNFTFGIAATTFAGQNIGAKKLGRMFKGTKELTAVALGTSIVMVTAILLLGKNLLYIFTTTPEIINLGLDMLKTLALGYIVFSVSQVLQGVMRGAGETAIPMWISIICTVIIRMPLAYIWAFLSRSAEFPNGDPLSLYGSLLVSWLCGCALSLFFYFKGKWRKRINETLNS